MADRRIILEKATITTGLSAKRIKAMRPSFQLPTNFQGYHEAQLASILHEAIDIIAELKQRVQQLETSKV
jgi:hypothetical protein